MLNFLKRLGPGFLVTAAFIGPGTIMTASHAGANFGYRLLFAVLFSVIAAVVLQEMAARLGIVTGAAGLGECLQSSFSNRFIRWVAITLVIGAIGIGNAAYQTGNITGAAVGLEKLTGLPKISIVAGIAVLCMLLIAAFKSQRPIQVILVCVVALMSFLFIATAIQSKPDWNVVMKSSLVPGLSSGNLLTVIGLIGTTVVPYNLFLHASAARANWQGEKKEQAIREARVDTMLSVVIGGVITAAILMTAAAAFHASGTKLASVQMVADQLGPILGGYSGGFFNCGLIAAGLTSSLTAPLAAGYAVSGCFGWKGDRSDVRFLAVAFAVILFGAVCTILFGNSPKQTILFAQVANGLILPLITLFLLIMMNRESVLGEYKNGIVANCLGGLILISASMLSVVKLAKLFW